MIAKGTKEYQEAGKTAKELQTIANYERRNNNSLYNLYYNDFYYLMTKLQKLNIFASKIAKTIDEACQVNSFKIANLSSKQAWILACAMIENNITLN
jgi:hypothetical protein